MDPINLDTGEIGPTGTSPALQYTWTNNRREESPGVHLSPAEEQCRRHTHTHMMREVTLFVPAVKRGCISRPVSVNMIYAAELERLCLLPGAHCPPAAHFFTSCMRVPEGRLLTEQLLQLDFKLDFTFNTAAAQALSAAKPLLILAAF